MRSPSSRNGGVEYERVGGETPNEVPGRGKREERAGCEQSSMEFRSGQERSSLPVAVSRILITTCSSTVAILSPSFENPAATPLI